MRHSAPKVFFEASLGPQKVGTAFARGQLVQIAALSLLYSAISFLWSSVGFISPTPPVHYHEYALPSIMIEILGHALFGVAAGIGTRRVTLALLCGADAVLIDSDHLLAALNLPVLGRLSHSFPFAVVISLILLAVPQRFVPRRALVLVTIASILSHLSYDVFAGNGQFPILAPLSFQSVTFPGFSWPILELAAVSAGVLAFLWKGEARLAKESRPMLTLAEFEQSPFDSCFLNTDLARHFKEAERPI
jgi:hypothetical protein